MERSYIFLIEDDVNDILLIQRALRKAGIDIPLEICKDGEAAICFLEKLMEKGSEGSGKWPAFVLLDLKIPRVSGLEVLRWIRENLTMRPLPVIIFSSSSQSRDIQRAYGLGANSYLVKPVEFEALLRTTKLLYQYWCQTNEIPR